MKAKLLLILCCALVVFSANAQYSLPACYPAWDPAATYGAGDRISYEGTNYEVKWASTSEPGGDGWKKLERCGNALGPDYSGSQRIIGYMPYWVPDFNIATQFDPGSVTHINLAFVLFKQNNNNYNSSDFASIAWEPFHKNKVDSILNDVGLLNSAHAKGTTVSIAVGGATDFAFLWLLTKYYNDDAKLDEMATLITNYVNAAGLDGVDLDLECWWPDAAITGTTEQGGRIRGTSWGGTADDTGPHPAGLGLTKLAQKLRQKMPNKLISAAVFGTSYYGNNYDDKMHEYMDWIGLMTYDFTGSWNTSPIGPHSSLYKIPEGTYQGQSAANPIYSVQDALEYWMGMAPPAWNHAGGFNVPKAKLVTGVPLYGYDLATRKPNNANGFLFVPYRNIIAEYPNAATTYDPLDPRQLGGYIGADGKKLYFETPKGAAAKIDYNKAYGHQGVIVWELTQDVPFSSSSSILKAVNEAADRDINGAPVANITSPSNGANFTTGSNITISANASDGDGSVAKVEFFRGTTKIGEDASAPYSVVFSNAQNGSYALTAKATDNEGSTGTSSVINITVGTVTNPAPTASITAPANNASFTAPATVNITANASDTAPGTVTKVEFYQGTTKLGEDTSSPYSFNWTNVAAGSYAITAKATDNGGLTGTSSVVNITVTTAPGCTTPAWVSTSVYTVDMQVSKDNKKYRARWWTQNNDPVTNSDPGEVWEYLGPCVGTGNVNPSASISSPANNASFAAPATVNISASASDSDGTIAKVEFFNGATKLGEDTNSPYSYSWGNVAAGTYTLTAKATDNAGGTGTSSAVTITVTGQSNVNPTASITSPANNASFSAPATVNISASASDSDGTISKVEFFNGSTKLGEDTSSPYSYSWGNVAAGTYNLTAKATDNAGGTGTSSSVAITVTGGNNDACATKPQYVENGGYVAGSQVKNAGNLYECKPYPYSGWCNGASWAYAPGTGTYWSDAWILVSSCSSSARLDLDEKVSASAVTVYPNPNIEGNTLHVDLDDLYKEVKVTVQSINGGKSHVYTFKNIKRLELNIPSLSKGLNLIKVDADNKTWTRKVLFK